MSSAAWIAPVHLAAGLLVVLASELFEPVIWFVLGFLMYRHYWFVRTIVAAREVRSILDAEEQ